MENRRKVKTNNKLEFFAFLLSLLTFYLVFFIVKLTYTYFLQNYLYQFLTKKLNSKPFINRRGMMPAISQLKQGKLLSSLIFFNFFITIKWAHREKRCAPQETPAVRSSAYRSHRCPIALTRLPIPLGAPGDCRGKLQSCHRPGGTASIQNPPPETPANQLRTHRTKHDGSGLVAQHVSILNRMSQ